MGSIKTCAVLLAGIVFVAAGTAPAATVVVGEAVPHSSGFNNFTAVPSLSSLDYADVNSGNGVTATAIGTLNGNSGAASLLINGVGQSNNDVPGESVFFTGGTTDGKFLLDLNGSIAVGQINSYSRHTGNRTPQKYDVFGSNAVGAPGTGSDTVAGLTGLGWAHITGVNVGGGSHNGIVGVGISDDGGAIGTYRHLLFNIDPPGGFDNTFYGEIDVVEHGLPVPQSVFYIGVNNGNNSDFDHENAADDHYYWEDGNYSALGTGGGTWSEGRMEIWRDDGGPEGFDRAVLAGDPINHIYFQLDTLEAAGDAQFSFVSDMVQTNGNHDLAFSMNGNLFHTVTNIGNGPIADTFTGADVGAVVGSNVITIERTGGPGGWIQFDYLSLDVTPGAAAPVIPEPMTMLAVGLGIAGLGGYVRKRKRA